MAIPISDRVTKSSRDRERENLRAWKNSEPAELTGSKTTRRKRRKLNLETEIPKEVFAQGGKDNSATDQYTVRVRRYGTVQCKNRNTVKRFILFNALHTYSLKSRPPNNISF